MKCPACNGEKLWVKDSRARGHYIRRRRRCGDCGLSFRTYEVIAESAPQATVSALETLSAQLERIGAAMIEEAETIGDLIGRQHKLSDVVSLRSGSSDGHGGNGDGRRLDG